MFELIFKNGFNSLVLRVGSHAIDRLVLYYKYNTQKSSVRVKSVLHNIIYIYNTAYLYFADGPHSGSIRVHSNFVPPSSRLLF